jgi:hypothetical protein
MIRLHSENDVILCARCGNYWTGTKSGHCSFCTAELAPIDWMRVAYWVAGIVAVAMAGWAVVST